MTTLSAADAARPASAATDSKRSRVRYAIVAMLFLVTAINYADRATLSIAGPALSKELGLSAVTMGYVFSAFGWSYVIGQLPGGWLLDRFGSKVVYFGSIFIWSVFTMLQGGISFITATAGTAVVALFALRFLVGFSEAPSFPANGRIVAAWFPANERGTASAVFNSAQYFATVLFAPIMGWITHTYGWPYVFYFMGALGIVVSFVWLKVIYGPKEHPSINKAELEYIEAGGALVNMDQTSKAGPASGAADTPKWGYVKQLLSNRMMLGVYIGQYCITTLTYFFLTWFPVYLVKERGFSILNAGFVAALPAICGFVGGVLGGDLGLPAAQGPLADLRAQDADRRRDAALDQHDRLQLRRLRRPGRRHHGLRLLRQGSRCTGLGGGVGHVAEGNRRVERRPLQHLRQHGRHHHADRHRLHRRRHRFVQRRTCVRRRQCAGGGLQLPVRGRRDQARGADQGLIQRRTP